MTVTVPAPCHVHMTINRAGEVKVRTHCSVQKEINICCWQHVLCTKRKTCSTTTQLSSGTWIQSKTTKCFPLTWPSDYSIWTSWKKAAIAFGFALKWLVSQCFHSISLHIILGIQRNKKYSILTLSWDHVIKINKCYLWLKSIGKRIQYWYFSVTVLKFTSSSTVILDLFHF